MSALLAIVPWALFGIMVLFGMIFAAIAWRATRRANDAEDKLNAAQMQLAQVEARAKAAEARIAETEQRARAAEARIADAERRASEAQEAARQADARAGQAEQRAGRALDEARRADSALRDRKNAADEKARHADQRARALLDWSRSEWESRREPDRQRAQAKQGSFQAQLEAFLEYRRAPVQFRVESEIDRLAAPLIPRFAEREQVDVQGDTVRVSFPVDASLGFRA
jgi:chromosome segregation ATPase